METKFWHKSREITLVQMSENNLLDLVNMNTHINFGEILSISSQDIERKRNFGANQGPFLW